MVDRLQRPDAQRAHSNRLSQNLTLRVAGARILEAGPKLGIAVGNLFPQSQSAFADYARVKLSTERGQPAGRQPGFPIGMPG